MPSALHPPAITIALYRRVAGSLWFAPTLYVLGGMLLAAAAANVGPLLPGPVRELLPEVKPEVAEDVLKLLASSTLTVATVIFSVLMVVLNMTASNFSPRALAGYMQDPVNQNMLGVFLGGFTFALTSLLLLQLVSYDERLVGLLLLLTMGVAFAALGALVYAIHHTASEVQITNLVVRLHREADEALTQFLGLTHAERAGPKASATLPVESAGKVVSEVAGHIQVLDPERMLKLAVEHDLVVHVLRRSGDFAARGTILCQVWPGWRLTPELADGFRRAYAFGARRTAASDPLLGMELLAEVAIRALSPGINDPNTAVDCLRYLGDLLIRLAGRDLPRRVLYDESGTARVAIPMPDFGDFLRQPLLGIARAGADKARVVRALLEELGQIAAAAEDPDRRQVVTETARAVADLCLPRLPLEWEREQVRAVLAELEPPHAAAKKVAATRMEK